MHTSFAPRTHVNHKYHQFTTHRPSSHPPRGVSSSSSQAETTSIPAHIFWDLDNVRPSSLEELYALGTDLRDYLARGGGIDISPVEMTVFANPTTFSRFPSSAYHTSTLRSTVEDRLHGDLILTTSRKQSVDLAMKGAMLKFVKSQNHNNCVAFCISDDADYVQIMRYCSYLGCTTVSVGENRMRKRPEWAPKKKVESLLLPAAADVAITLRRPSFSSSDDDDDVDEKKKWWRIDGVWVNPKSTSSPVVLSKFRSLASAPSSTTTTSLSVDLLTEI